jgi:serine/threonine protein kinase
MNVDYEASAIMAKSLAPQDIPQLLNLLTQSGLLVADPLERARQLAQSATNISHVLQLWIGAELLSPWQTAQLAAGQFVLKLGPYHLVDELGEWDFGRAFRARHAPTEKTVTLKLLANRWLQPEERWRKTAGQLRKAQQLNHPHLAPFHHVSRVAQRTFLITELEPRSDFLRLRALYGPPSPGQAARLLHQAALGLAQLHAAGLVHGCLRPARVTVSAEGVVQIQDLGLAPLAPELLELYRQRAAAAGTEPTAKNDPFLPPASEMEGVTEFHWDVALLARMGAVLLQPVEIPSSLSQEPPAWWSAPSPGLSAIQLLDRIQESADPTTPSWTAQRLAEVLADNIPAKPTASSPTETSLTETSLTEKSTPARPVSVSRNPAAAMGVMIDTQRRRKRPISTDDERLAAVQRLRRRRAAWLYGSVGMTVVVLLLLLAVTFRGALAELGSSLIASRRADDALKADADDGDRNEEAAAAEFPDPESLEFPSPEVFAAIDGEDEDASVVSSPDGGEDGIVQNGEQPVAGHEELGTADDAPSSDPNSDTADLLTNQSDPPPSDAASSPEEVAATDPNTESAPDSESMTADSPTAQSDPADAPVLAGIPSSVNLPDRENAIDGPASLFPVAIPAGYPIQLELLGGDRILRGNTALRVEHAEGGTAERMWDVQLVAGNVPPTAISRLTLEEDSLTFQWLSASGQHPESAQLRNCILSFAAGSESHRMSLRQPVMVAAPTMDFERGISTVRWEILDPPDWERCQLEFLGLEGPFPETRQIPSPTLPEVQGEQWVLVGQQPEEQGLVFHVEVRRRRQLDLTLTSLLFTGDAPAPQLARRREARITTANRRRWTPAARNRMAQAEQRQIQLNSLNPQALRDRPAQQELARQQNLAQVDLAAAQQDAARLERIEQWASTMHEQGKLHYRIYFELGGHQVELLRTE